MNLKVSGVESAPFNSALSELHKAEQLLPALRVLASSSDRSPACFPGRGQGAHKDVCV